MRATELLVQLLQRGQDGFVKMAGRVPEDKLDWQPDPALRSALDQMQELATILDFMGGAFEKREVTFDPEMFARYQAQRKLLATREACIEALREATRKLCDLTAAMPEEDLGAPVKMPWPVERNVADMIHYHVWNMAYHEGQIAAILQRLGIDPMG